MTTPLSDERLAELRRLAALGLRAHVPCTVPAQALTDLLDEVERLRARNAELEAVLRSVEWNGAVVLTVAGYPPNVVAVCPICQKPKNSGAHSSDCTLDAALRGAGE